MMKIAIAQLNYHIGNFKDNVDKVRATIAKVKDANADIVVFSELSICGYPARDFLEFEDFISLCDESINTIAKDCKDIAVIIGAPSKNPNPNGKGLFNSAYLLSDGMVKLSAIVLHGINGTFGTDNVVLDDDVNICLIFLIVDHP